MKRLQPASKLNPAKPDTRTKELMSAKNLVKIIVLVMWGCLFLFFPFRTELVEAADDITWQSIVTKHTIIRYQTLEDLKRFDRDIDYSPGRSGLNWIFKPKDSDNLIDRIRIKVDALYERVQQILDMRKKTAKVKINIYNNKGQLESAFYKNYKKNRGLRAWYIYEFNTIYVNVKDLHEGMLAHEMAHSIVDRFLSVRPPRATAEILARYVDSHLLK